MKEQMETSEENPQTVLMGKTTQKWTKQLRDFLHRENQQTCRLTTYIYLIFIYLNLCTIGMADGENRLLMFGCIVMMIFGTIMMIVHIIRPMKASRSLTYDDLTERLQHEGYNCGRQQGLLLVECDNRVYQVELWETELPSGRRIYRTYITDRFSHDWHLDLDELYWITSYVNTTKSHVSLYVEGANKCACRFETAILVPEDFSAELQKAVRFINQGIMDLQHAIEEMEKLSEHHVQSTIGFHSESGCESNGDEQCSIESTHPTESTTSVEATATTSAEPQPNATDTTVSHRRRIGFRTSSSTDC